MDYYGFVLRLAHEMGAEQTDADFAVIIPAAIDYAEQRLYRELGLLSTIVVDNTAIITANSRGFVLPQAGGRFVTIDAITFYTPVGTTFLNGTANALTPVSRHFAEAAWGTNTAPSAASVPRYFAMFTDQIVILAPVPGATFQVAVTGTVRPTALSTSSTTSFLTLYLPDLFLSAAMIYAASVAGATPRHPPDYWEKQYGVLSASASQEEIRKKFSSPPWAPPAPPPSVPPPPPVVAPPG